RRRRCGQQAEQRDAERAPKLEQHDLSPRSVVVYFDQLGMEAQLVVIVEHRAHPFAVTQRRGERAYDLFVAAEARDDLRVDAGVDPYGDRYLVEAAAAGG